MSHSPGQLEVLYHDGPCIVVNKPSGLLTQAPPGIDSMENWVRQYVQSREEKTGNIYLGVPHRLDRPVSGVMIFARHVRATRRLAQQFEKRTIRKSYWALVPAADIPLQDTWLDHLRKIPGRAFVEVVREPHVEGKLAQLSYQMIRRHDNHMLLNIELQTGRTHQIRVQASSRGLPILGDDQYGSTVLFGPALDDPRDRAIGLHARSLEFEHPMTREMVAVEAPLPAIWAEFGDWDKLL